MQTQCGSRHCRSNDTPSRNRSDSFHGGYHSMAQQSCFTDDLNDLDLEIQTTSLENQSAVLHGNEHIILLLLL